MLRNFYILVLLQLFWLPSCVAQSKSTHVQTIEGKQYYIHRIEKSQSLYAISKLYNVPLEEIYRINPELKNGAKANQEIKIPYNYVAPVATTSATPVVDTNRYMTHKVLRGETVYSISRKYSLSEKQLVAYNPGLEQGTKEGQLLIVGEKQKKRNRDHKEKDNRQPPPVVTVQPEFTGPLVIDSSLFKTISKPKKNSYLIGLMLPFRLDETLQLNPEDLARSSSGFPSVPAISADFYLGFKKALDSLRSPDFNPNVALYDVDDKDSLKITQIMNEPSFRNLDMIFGPLYANEFKLLSQKARENYIPVVSPLTQQNKILYNNNHISKTNPSQFTLLEHLADYCMDSLHMPGTRLILVIPEKDRRELSYTSSFKEYYSKRLQEKGRPVTDSLFQVHNMDGVKAVFLPNARNIVVTLSSNQVFIADFTTQLAIFSIGKELVLCGWQGTSEMDNIDQEYLNQLRYTFPYQFNITNVSAYNRLAEEYHRRLNTLPDEYFFIGFDIGVYYMSLLKQHGPDFIHQLDELPMETSYQRFNFARPDKATGFDNRGAYIFRYEDYQLRKTGWK